MKSSISEKGINIHFSREEALVFLEWLYHFNETSNKEGFNDQAEQRILWDLESLFESFVPEIFDPEYKKLLEKARSMVRDKEE